MKKKLLSILLCLALLLCLAPAALAEGEGSFCFFAATTSQTLIGPVRISYSSGQTIQEALDASGYSFERYGAFIEVIEGVEGGYLIYYDGGGYDLTEPASSVTAVMIRETENMTDEHLALLRYMIEYSEMENNVQKYTPAQTAYNSALTALRIGNAADAESCLAALQAAVSEYESILNGEKVTVSITATQNGETLQEPAVKLTDAYGNVTTGTGSAQVVPGTYTLSVSDGGWNRTEQTVEIEGDASYSLALPYGEWFGEIKILDLQRSKEAYESSQDKTTHTMTVQIPDTSGPNSPILNAAQGVNIPSVEGTRLYGVYTGINGVYYGNTARSWSSTAASLSSLIEQGMGERTFTLEARYQTGETTQIQSYTVEIQRVPTLASLSVIEENTVLPLGFDPLTREYTVTTTADAVTISAEPYSTDYTVTGTGMTSASEQTVTVACGERSNSYTVHIQKKEAVNVTMNVPSGTTAQVYNGADSEIMPVDGVYHLVPSEEYYYIATKDTYYHSRASFTASEGLTVSAAEPDTTDRLSGFVLYNSNNINKRTPYALDEDFTPADHDLGCTIADALSSVYAQATPTGGYTVQALYNKQTQVDSTNGTPHSPVVIDKTVSESGSANILQNCVASSGYSQTVMLRVAKEEGAVTQYQDYELLIRRSEHLKSLALSADADPVQLLDSSGNAVSFDRDRVEYSVSVDRGVLELKLSAAFNNESDASSACGGYYALVNGERYDAISEAVLPLDQEQDTQTVTIRVCHEDENAVPTTYTVTVNKTDPVAVTFNVTPSNATVFVKNNTTGKRTEGDDNSFLLIPGQTYTYTVTAAGYVGQQVTDYTVPAVGDAVAITLTAAQENDALPDYDAFWGSSRYDEYSNGVVDVKTPVTAEDSALYWATKVGEGYSSDACGCPIIVNGYLYTYAGNKIYKIDTISGEILAEGTMDHSSSFAINAPTYAEGMIFIGESNGTVQAFNAETLESVWIYHDVLKGQPNCPIIYKDGYIYTGFWCGESSNANYVCMSVTDEDTSAAKEEKLPTWTYTSKGGFYWAGSYVSDDYLLIVTDDGSVGYTKGYAKILSLNPGTGNLLDAVTMPYPGDLRSGVTFVPDGSGGGRGYFTSKGGYFYRIDVNSNGTFVAGSLKGLRLQNYANDASNPPMSTSTPTIYNGRAYVGVSGTAQFGQYSGHNITVIDLEHWSIAYSVRTQGYPQTSGLLTTSYEAETGSVNVYFFDNYTPGKLRMISDKPGQTAPSPITVESYTAGGQTISYDTGYVLFTPFAEQAQYAICSPIVDEYGTIYFKNDSAYMMALGSSITELEVTTQPTKTTYTVGEVFDPEGMTVTAKYANGMTRDVTDYLEWSEEPLTANDTQFQIFFPYMMYHDEEGAAGTKIPEPFAVLDFTINEAAVVKGDVNLDGEITATDAAIVYAIVRNTYTLPLTDEQIAAADIDGDGEITASDAARLYAYCRGDTNAIPQP